MSKKYHITPSQRIMECNNPENCPFWENPHFDTANEAEAYRDNMAMEQNGTLPMFIMPVDENAEANKRRREEIENIRKDLEEKIAALENAANEEIDKIARKMGKWHITASGRVMPCTFEDEEKCPFRENPHFKTEKEAEEYRDKMQKELNGAMFKF